jgi:hypothetical protein
MVLKIKINSDSIKNINRRSFCGDSLCFLEDKNGVFIFYSAKLRMTNPDQKLWLLSDCEIPQSLKIIE